MSDLKPKSSRFFFLVISFTTTYKKKKNEIRDQSFLIFPVKIFKILILSFLRLQQFHAVFHFLPNSDTCWKRIILSTQVTAVFFWLAQKSPKIFLKHVVVVNNSCHLKIFISYDYYIIPRLSLTFVIISRS